MGNFINADRETDYLFPPPMQDWLPEDHLTRFVADVVDQLDLSEVNRQYAGRGSRAHHPAVLLGLLIYGYATGVFSSRKIERATYDSIAFRYLAANTHPDHDTITTFRRRFLPQLEDLQFLAQSESGLGTFISSAAEGLSQGIDMTINAVPWSFLRIDGGLQYLDAKYTEGELKDFKVPVAPEWSGNIATTLLLPLGDGVTYTRLDYSFMSDHYVSPNFQPDFAEQDKENFNIRIGWRNDNWDIAAWMKNATDYDYASVLAAPLGFSGTEFAFVEAPKTYGLTARYSF